MRLSSFSEITQIRDFLFSASSFGRDQSELEISRKDDRDVKSKIKQIPLIFRLILAGTKFVKKVCIKTIGWLGNVQRFIKRAEPLHDSFKPFVLRHFRCRCGL